MYDAMPEMFVVTCDELRRRGGSSRMRKRYRYDAMPEMFVVAYFAMSCGV